eukprot:6275693-Pyramimonas_sp.AAC.1
MKKRGSYARWHSALTRWLTRAASAARHIVSEGATARAYADSLRANVGADDPVFSVAQDRSWRLENGHQQTQAQG